LRTSAIIPVKTFENAKTRLNLSSNQRSQLCKIMFEEVISTVSQSDKINKIIVVSKDKSLKELAEKFDFIQLGDEELGVNAAVSIADDFLRDYEIDASVVLPQDIPLMTTDDLDNLLNFTESSKSILIVPSRRFDGTNALVRKPSSVMETHYDEDSYKIHLKTGKAISAKTSLVLIKRIMIDVDNQHDIEFLLKQNEKPNLCDKINRIFS